jgi:hypothetical protein
MANGEKIPMTPILGYQQQPQEKLDLVNSHKASEEMLLRHLDLLSQRGDIDKRWLAIARTHFEQGYMALNRSVLQPQRLTSDPLPSGPRP